MARRLQADRPSHCPLAPASDRLAGSPRPQAATAGQPAPAPTGQGSPGWWPSSFYIVPGRPPEQRQELDGDHPHQQAIGCLAEDAQRRHGAATLKGVGHVGQHDGGEHHRRQGGQRRPPGRQGTPGRQPSNSAGPTGTMASETTASTGPRNPRREPGRPRPASEPTGSAVAAPSPPARVARRQGPAAAAGRYRCPGRGSAAPTGPGGSVRRQRPWEPHLEDGDPRTWAVSLWPTRIRQRMGVGWEARVLM